MRGGVRNPVTDQWDDGFTSASSHPELTVGELALPPAVEARFDGAETGGPLLLRRRVLALVLLLSGIAGLLWGHDSTSRNHGGTQANLYGTYTLKDLPAPARSADRTQADHSARLDAALDPMSVLLSQAAIWLSENFELPTASHMPQVELVAPARIAALRYGPFVPQTSSAGQGTTSPTAGSVVAVYDDTRQVIYLPEGWTAVSPADQSVLVHELVHHMQKSAGLTYECPQQREKLAYQAQARWLERFGSSLEKEFDLDPLSLLVHSSCL
jgi:hypothetical protein